MVHLKSRSLWLGVQVMTLTSPSEFCVGIGTYLIYTLVTWIVGLSSHSEFVEDNKLDGRDAGQRDLDKLQQWAWANLIKFNKAKYNTLLMAGGNPKHLYGLGDEWIENNPVKKDLDG